MTNLKRNLGHQQNKVFDATLPYWLSLSAT